MQSLSAHDLQESTCDASGSKRHLTVCILMTPKPGRQNAFSQRNPQAPRNDSSSSKNNNIVICKPMLGSLVQKNPSKRIQIPPVNQPLPVTVTWNSAYLGHTTILTYTHVRFVLSFLLIYCNVVRRSTTAVFTNRTQTHSLNPQPSTNSCSVTLTF